MIALSTRLEHRLRELGSNVWADTSVVERIRGDAEKGRVTEAEALKRLADYELRLTLKVRTELTEPLSSRRQSELWQGSELRAFISHRDTHRGPAQALATALGRYQISCFVAHESIEATEEWRRATRDGLETMHAMVAFVTDDFHLSPWTMQEVGYALGKRIPCISVMVETSKPPGFLEPDQSLRGNLENPTDYAAILASHLADTSGRRSRIQQALIAAFRDSRTAQQARDRFTFLRDFVERLDEGEINNLLEAINGEAVLRNAFLQRDKDVRKVIAFLMENSDQPFELVGSNLTSLRAATR